MPVIQKSAALRNSYGKISDYCRTHDEAVFITRNGEGDLAVMSIHMYEELTGKKHLYHLLEQGSKAIREGKFIGEEKMDKILDEV